MKLSLRWKFLLVLLAFGLAPLLVKAGLDAEDLIELGGRLSGQVSGTLEEHLAQELENNSRQAAEVLRLRLREGQLLLAALVEQAREIWDTPSPDWRGPLPLWADQVATREVAADFDGPGAEHARPLGRGGLLDVGVDSSRVAFWLPASARRQEPPPVELARLERLATGLTRLATREGDDFFRALVVTPGGLTMLFPAQGGLPPDWDPRDSQWYRLILAHPDQPVWLTEDDPLSGQPVHVAALALTGPEGRVEAVLARQVLLTRTLDLDELQGRWSKEAKADLVRLADLPADQGQGRGLKVLFGEHLATSDPTGRPRLPEADAASPDGDERADGGMGMGMGRKGGRAMGGAMGMGGWLMTRDENDQRRRLVDDMSQRPSGALALDEDGERNVWAYAQVRGDLYLVVTLPQRVVSALPQEMGQLLRDHLFIYLRHGGLLALGVALALALGAWWLARRVSRPITLMASAAQQVAEGDLSARMADGFGDERDQVAQSFNRMVPLLADHLRLKAGVELAQQVQQSLLPVAAPQLPGLQAAGASVYSEETGGDYYDFFLRGGEADPRLAVVLGDVSGHGIPAALLMATVRALLRQRAQQAGDPGQVITDVNRQLCRDTVGSGRFVTLFYAEIDPVRRRVAWVRAGHDPALVYDPQAREFSELVGPGLSLGVEGSWRYQTQEAELAPGRVLVMGTDGIWEARDANGRMWGKEPLRELIARHAQESPGLLAREVLGKVPGCGPGQSPEDDVTLVVIRLEAPVAPGE